jgi:predicted nucleic acid-binding protein
MRGSVLVDTSAWIDALRKDGDTAVREAVYHATAEGEAVLCDIVRLELWNGARGDAERKILRALERDLDVAPSPAEVWDAAVRLAAACRRKGITVPATDLLVAACASHHGLGLLHHDEHFDQIERATGRDHR